MTQTTKLSRRVCDPGVVSTVPSDNLMTESFARFHTTDAEGLNGWMGTEVIRDRVAAIDWEGVRAMIADRGYATAAPLLSPADCAELIGLYDDRARFRSRVDMARLRFG